MNGVLVWEDWELDKSARGGFLLTSGCEALMHDLGVPSAIADPG